MAKQIISTDAAPKPWAGYSQAVKAAGLVFVSGTAPMDVNGDVVGTTTGEQTAQCLKNVSRKSSPMPASPAAAKPKN